MVVEAISRAFPEPDTVGGHAPSFNTKFDNHRVEHAEKKESRRQWFAEGGAMFRKAVFALAFAVIGAAATALVSSLGTVLNKDQPFKMAPTNGVVK